MPHSKLNDLLVWLSDWGAGSKTCEAIWKAHQKNQKLVRAVESLVTGKDVADLDEAVRMISEAVPSLRDRDWTR